MPRENSLSDSEGRSLTSNESEEDAFAISPASANYSQLPEVASPYRADLSRIKTQSRKSIHSKVSKAVPSPAVHQAGFATMTPKDKFRAAVRKVMAMRRGTTLLGNVGGIGAEPGIDPRRPAVDAAYSHIKEQCQIEIMDYSAIRNTTRHMDNAQFIEFMGDLDSPELPQRDPWVKVRWINIGGISWDVIRALSIKYNLHPLALEDVFHGHSRNRSKADYYSKHLFLRILCHELLDDEEKRSRAAFTQYTTGPRSNSPEPLESYPDEEEEKVNMDDSEELKKPTSSFPSRAATLVQRRGQPSLLPTNRNDLKGAYNTGKRSPTGSNLSTLVAREGALQLSREEQKQDEAAIEALKKGSRINVDVTPMFFFLFRDGTIISIRPIPNLSLTQPISFRLKSRDTVLRKSADPSLLLHALLDLIVDKAVQVIEAYHAKIHKFEKEILLRPQMNTVRDLHILSGDLILHKRTLDPIKTLIYGLRRYDVDRCAALIDSSDPANKDVRVVGFMSHKAKIYLADVYDHMDYILTSLDMFAGIAQNLIDYTFNMSSYEMNEVMRRLTMATIIFLPLTVLTGYFGMNFSSMWSVDKHTDLLFWEIAIPIMVVTLPLALWGDLKKFWHYIHKRSAATKAIKTM
ncbi:Cobalt/magnesium transport protein CorA [Psilocybe cubensis]|uniref:Magnesium transport protein CorA n=2 Tax=Psilocybe cubensis TaxID=181762 RepID=A0A8H7Y9D0_PSICU|nr:Cobalt/magnesium transport protein CorA [Psilocybe cubensis]KAH9486074.1 Cobalt/magnesium transport protein CorA [Psilocybe cubensis]